MDLISGYQNLPGISKIAIAAVLLMILAAVPQTGTLALWLAFILLFLTVIAGSKPS